jgi:hypothetical protein
MYNPEENVKATHLTSFSGLIFFSFIIPSTHLSTSSSTTRVAFCKTYYYGRKLNEKKIPDS